MEDDIQNYLPTVMFRGRKKSIGVYLIFVSIVSESQFNGFRSDMSSTVLDIKGCLQFISFNKSFAQIFFT